MQSTVLATIPLTNPWSCGPKALSVPKLAWRNLNHRGIEMSGGLSDSCRQGRRATDTSTLSILFCAACAWAPDLSTALSRVSGPEQPGSRRIPGRGPPSVEGACEDGSDRITSCGKNGVQLRAEAGLNQFPGSHHPIRYPKHARKPRLPGLVRRRQELPRVRPDWTVLSVLSAEQTSCSGRSAGYSLLPRQYNISCRRPLFKRATRR